MKRVNAQRQSSPDGEKLAPFCQEDDSGRCSLQFPKVLEDQSFIACSPNVLDCAFHFGFSFCLLLCLCSLMPPFQDHLSNKLPGPRTLSLAPVLKEPTPRNLICKFLACWLASCLIMDYILEEPAPNTMSIFDNDTHFLKIKQATFLAGIALKLDSWRGCDDSPKPCLVAH